MKKSLSIIFLLLLCGLLVYYFLPEERLPAHTRIDKLVVIKSERTMHAYAKGKLVKVYSIAIGRNAVGDKEYEGDKRTPEGSYYIEGKNPNSGYHKNLGISYPDKTDQQEANAKGVRAGGDVKIHGLKNGMGLLGKFHRLRNWTAGCIAVTDEEMDELYDAVAIGTPIIIRP
ncbi:murein L,D-transpeptidase family protein [Ohtaekwangia kribbensis]|uniref:Murein L,D-transpeptidase family protein n=1 Tax=Ohtaekwangia kribbensis TaxID=688913 RepID=A0ABW3JWB6_9BACT